MKTRFIKFISILLIAILICGVLSGCADRGEPSLEVNIDSVPALQRKIDLTVTAENTKFAGGLSADSITLSGAFADMTVEIKKVKGNTVDILLTGEINTDKYSDGLIDFAAGSFVDGSLQLGTSIYVEQVCAKFDNGSPEYKDGVFSVKIKTSGYVFSNTFSASDITFGNYAIESASAVDGIITFAVKVEADSLDDAIEKINGIDATISAGAVGASEDVCVPANFISASFYYSAMIKEYDDDGNIVLTLNLSTVYGKFADGFGKSNVELGCDLDKAVLDSAVITDGVATLMLTVPVSDDDEERFDDIHAMIALGDGSLINDWGTAVDETTYFCQTVNEPRSFATADDRYKTARDICEYVGNSQMVKALGPIGSLVNLFTGAVVTSFDLSKAFGFVKTSEPSEFDIMCGKLDVISAQLSAQDAKLNEILSELKRTEVNNKRKSVSEFNVKMTLLESYTKSLSDYITYAATDLMNGHDAPEQLLDAVSEKMLQAYASGKSDREIYDMLSDDEKQLIKDWNEYYNTLFGYIETKANSGSTRGNSYAGYNSTRDNLKRQLETVCSEISGSEVSIFKTYDSLCENTYLFDVASIPSRELYRASVKGSLSCALSVLSLAYGEMDVDSLKKNETLQTLYQNFYAPAIKVIDDASVSRDYTEAGFEKNITFYPATYRNSISTYFDILQYEYDLTDVLNNPSLRSEVETKAAEYYGKIQNTLFWQCLDNNEWQELRSRLYGFDYTGWTNGREVMPFEAYTMARVLGYVKEAETVYDTVNYRYLESFDSFELSWEAESVLVVKLKNCVIYDMVTGKMQHYDSYTYYNNEDNEPLFVIYFSSKHAAK